MPTCKCGKTVEDWRGARGHVQFTEGDGHGEKDDVPDSWRDLFSEDDEGGEQADDDAGAGGDDQSPTESKESNSEQSEPSESNKDDRTLGDRLKTALTDDVSALWGGDR